MPRVISLHQPHKQYKTPRVGGMTNREMQRKGEVEKRVMDFLGLKATSIPLLPVPFTHCAPLAPWGMGAACRRCLSPVNQSVIGSNGIDDVKRNPPATKHVRWSQLLFTVSCLTRAKILLRLLSFMKTLLYRINWSTRPHWLWIITYIIFHCGISASFY